MVMNVLWEHFDSVYVGHRSAYIRLVWDGLRWLGLGCVRLGLVRLG